MGGGGGGLGDFSLYSEIFLGATPEPWNKFWRLLGNKEKFFRGYSKFFCWFSALQMFDLIDTTYWCKLLQVKGPQNAGPKIKAAVSLLKWFGIIVYVYK